MFAFLFNAHVSETDVCEHIVVVWLKLNCCTFLDIIQIMLTSNKQHILPTKIDSFNWRTR